ncbi:hypothetical protein ACT7C7_30580 [Bacillus cereus]
MVKSKTKLKKIIPVTMLLTATLTSAPLSSFAAEKKRCTKQLCFFSKRY